jgi:hypothetical protein
MTGLEAYIPYILAKNIAITAISGIKNLSVNGTTLNIETNNGQKLEMKFPTPKNGRGIESVRVNDNNHLIVTYDDGQIEDAGLIRT